VSDADYVVYTIQGFLDTLALMVPGDTLYIDNTNNTIFDFSSESIPIIIDTSSITIASNRGEGTSSGATLMFDYNDVNNSLFIVHAANVRFTGLRITGPCEGYNNICEPTKGISVDGGDNFEVDNCEISRWPGIGINIFRSSEVYVHHNHIHDNNMKGYGYGVNVAHKETGNEGTYVVYEANILTDNKHAIAGTGHPDIGYIARYNIVDSDVQSHSFDMHGWYHHSHVPSDTQAGRFVKIHNNTFLGEAPYAIAIRGRPVDDCFIAFNDFAAFPHEEMAIRQRFDSNEYGIIRIMRTW